jgi:hypothetical protein
MSMVEGEGYHFPPDLMELTIRAISVLLRGKQGVIDFFRGCGVPSEHLEPHQVALRTDKDAVKKAAIARDVLTALNERNDTAHLGARRQVLKRIVEWEDYDTAWPQERDAARGVVAAVRERIEKSDAFTRMNQERERERSTVAASARERVAAVQDRRQRIESTRRDLSRLFSMSDKPQQRGTALEGVLNNLFSLDGLLVREAFRRNEGGIGTVEQIDGAIEVSGQLYIVEMKWHSERVGPDLLQSLLGGLFLRPDVVGGLFISASGYTKPGVQQCREFLSNKLVVLSELHEYVQILEQEASILEFINEKRNAALLDKNPLVYPLGPGHVE